MFGSFNVKDILDAVQPPVLYETKTLPIYKSTTMSRKSKNVTIEQVVEQFNKLDLDEKVKAFTNIKGALREALDEREKELDEQKSKIESISNSLNS